ncbi:Hypothetical predicted protein, partial [Paramuricea clavata]
AYRRWEEVTEIDRVVAKGLVVTRSCELFGFGKALMTFMGDVESTLTKGMWEDKTVKAKKEIMIIRNTQFVADIVESVEVLGVDKGTGCLKSGVPAGVVTEGFDDGLQSGVGTGELLHFRNGHGFWGGMIC